jgi:hexosaminidase
MNTLYIPAIFKNRRVIGLWCWWLVGRLSRRQRWCDPLKTWQNVASRPLFRVREHALINAFLTLKAYTFDPLANLTSEQASLVLGSQHFLWTEQSEPKDLDLIVWPRAATSAEDFWMGPGRNDSAALPRLHELSYRLRRHGVNVISPQPRCAHLNT